MYINTNYNMSIVNMIGSVRINLYTNISIVYYVNFTFSI